GRLTSILASPRPASSRQAMAAHDERRICRCILEISWELGNENYNQRSMSEPLWKPSPEGIRRANLVQFVHQAQGRWRSCERMNIDYAQLYEWSIAEPAEFWQSMWDFGGIRASLRGGPVVVDLDRMPGARFFPNVRLNFAENLMFRGSGQAPAIIFKSETGATRTLSWDTLRTEVTGFAGALRAMGIRPGDRVAGFVPNMPEAIIAALGAAAVGAVWSSC